MKYIVFILMLLCLGACAPKNPLGEFRFQTVVASPYVNASWYKITKPGDVLHVYIEGNDPIIESDRDIPENPTPKDLFLRKIASDDSWPNVAYMARPCQYFQTGACQPSDWTTGRFSQKIIDSVEKSIFDLMKKARTDRVVLIGYAGGAQIAGLIAVEHPNTVIQVYTIAGILDHEAWTTYHGMRPLSESKNLKQVQGKFLKIPQHHFAGEKDTVVPSFLVQDFVAKENLTVLENATHDSGYKKIYPILYGRK